MLRLPQRCSAPADPTTRRPRARPAAGGTTRPSAPESSKSTRTVPRWVHSAGGDPSGDHRRGANPVGFGSPEGALRETSLGLGGVRRQPPLGHCGDDGRHGGEGRGGHEMLEGGSNTNLRRTRLVTDAPTNYSEIARAWLPGASFDFARRLPKPARSGQSMDLMSGILKPPTGRQHLVHDRQMVRNGAPTRRTHRPPSIALRYENGRYDGHVPSRVGATLRSQLCSVRRVSKGQGGHQGLRGANGAQVRPDGARRGVGSSGRGLMAARGNKYTPSEMPQGKSKPSARATIRGPPNAQEKDRPGNTGGRKRQTTFRTHAATSGRRATRPRGVPYLVNIAAGRTRATLSLLVGDAFG